MKRVALIAIYIAVIATLFAFPVFADTPVQPLQVITYSDTTTNVRISGTAERLHYNIDSFQVVFMSPPNNYGTSCTPVLVSFRFYNASDTPAYVGQAEFELTATTGTGSVNTIIYGYDQISTDLFVAESSYSTAEVGRIGIGASNDFAYYTGFVIPPRTSLYFSCIVYVNASAYAQNNTGATEDVNQVTLSSLNLYSNQISFSEDYPYHNQPIDFSDVIDAISDLSSTVSKSSELQDLIDAVTFTGNGYIYNAGNYNNAVFNGSFPDSSNVMATMNFRRFIGQPYLIDLDVDNNSSTDTSYVNGTKRYPFYIRIATNVSNDSKLYFESKITNIFPANTVVYIDSFYSDIYSGMYRNNQDTIFQFKHKIGNYTYLDSGWYNTYIVGYIDVQYDTNLTFPGIDISSAIRNISLNTDNVYLPIDEYTILRDLYIAYQNVNGLDDIDNTTDDIKDKSESAHTQEQSYFTQNSQAIQQTGLSNYRFNGDQENGIGSVSHDFTLLWNALGGFNSIYIFSLTLSLALMILRHAPGVIRSSRRNKEE